MTETHGDPSPLYRLHLRTRRVGGVDELHGVVTELKVGTDQEWTVVRAAGIEQWETMLDEPDSTSTLEQRIRVMTRETGWELVAESSTDDRLVRRRVAGLRSQVVADEVAVMTGDTGDLVDLCPIRPGEDTAQTLARYGWGTGARLPGWTIEVHEVFPQDWHSVLSRVRATRDHVRASAAARERGWRELVRMAQLSGVSTQELTALTGLTRQRLYQIRDRRR